MRLNKYIASAGVASRRKADELTIEGKVKINGAVMKQPGYDVCEGDVVEVDGQIIESAEKLCYYALNKPVGYVTTLSDEKNRPTVASILSDVTTRVYPVGRLDIDTSGLLIMTNDGSLTNRITHPRNEVFKTYVARINGVPKKEELNALRNGVVIEDKKTHKKYTTKPAYAEFISQKAYESTLEIKIAEGKNRQVRKMVEAIGYKVLELQRTAIGDVRLGRTKEGTYRKLTDREIDYLKNC